MVSGRPTQRGADYLARTQLLGVPDQIVAAMGVTACRGVAAGLTERQIVDMIAGGITDYDSKMGTHVPLGVELDLVAAALAVLCPNAEVLGG